MHKFRQKIDDLVGKRHQESSMCCHPADSFGTWCCTGCAWCGRPWIHWSFYVTLASVPLKMARDERSSRRLRSKLCLQVVRLYTLHQPSRRRELCCELLQMWLDLVMSAVEWCQKMIVTTERDCPRWTVLDVQQVWVGTISSWCYIWSFTCHWYLRWDATLECVHLWFRLIEEVLRTFTSKLPSRFLTRLETWG